YTLEILIKEEDAKNINSNGQKVTILKSVDSGQSVTWVAFSPFERNTVTWTEKYAVYASTTEIKDGARIDKMSDRSANPQYFYSFQNGVFDMGSLDEKSLTKTQYGIINKTDGNLQFGLSQERTVNGKNANVPINVVTVFKSQKAIFTPRVTLTIFLQGNYDNGVVITEVLGDPT